MIKDFPKASRIWVVLRILCGIAGFICISTSAMYIPIFIINIIFNTAPFITAILGFFINKETINKVTILCILGSFTGVILIALAKKKKENDEIED